MKKKYFPFLLSKDGELAALKELNSIVKDEICPIIQYVPDTHDKLENFLVNEWTFPNNLIFIDFLHIQEVGPPQSGGVTKLVAACKSAGCNVGLCIRPDASTLYKAFVLAMIAKYNIEVIIIIPIDFMHAVNSVSKTILNDLGLQEQGCRILLDAGYVTKGNVKNVSAIVNLGLSTLPLYNKWVNVIVASGSFPVNLSDITPSGKKHLLPRFEVDIWNTVQAHGKFNNRTKYSDYGIKNPEYSQAAFLGTCSIKYTDTSHFVIFRGELSGNHKDGNGQYITFAKQLVTSSHFPGRTFSWGDEQIFQKSLQTLVMPKIKTGNAGSWVKYGQNHHITLLHSIL